MKPNLKLAGIAALLLAVSACSTTQTTSGRDYLARYTPQARESILAGKGASPNLDKQVMEISQVEPDLHFPARIGVARIEKGMLTAVPVDELRDWDELGQEMGPETGTFVPVSPMIAAMVRPAHAKQDDRATRTIADIRRGAARQHLDYVLAYEVLNNSSSEANFLSVADISLLGLFVLPSRNVQVASTANAILLDVRNGYPYGTATGYATKKEAVRAAYQLDGRQARTAAANEAAVKKLTKDVREMMVKLAFAQTPVQPPKRVDSCPAATCPKGGR